MNWRLTWAKAQITPVIASSMIWIVVAGLAPAWVELALVTVWVTAVMAWNSRLMLWCRLGATPLTGVERELVLRALVPAASLRGRHQPTVWRGSRLSGIDVVAANVATLVWSASAVKRISAGLLDDDGASAMATRAMGVADIAGSRVVAAVSVFTLPWRALVQLLGRVFGQLWHGRLGRVSWHARWLIVAVAVLDLWGRTDWFGLTVLVLVAFATITTGRWQACWDARRDELESRGAACAGANRAQTRTGGCRNSYGSRSNLESRARHPHSA